MLESLCRGAGTIHELNLDGAFPARMRYRPREIYEGLKATELFDAERGQWNRHGDQSLHRTSRDAYVQLLGVLVEAQFNLTGARALYETLKATPLYDAARRQWNVSMSRAQKLQDSSRDADAQLLGVLVEAQFNPECAALLYEELKATPLYDAARRQWNAMMSKSYTLETSWRYTTTQLLGVLVEALVNPEGARALYAELKSTTLYDAAWEQWNWHMSDCSIELDTDRHSSAQLLGVLVEAQFNPERARALYEKLKGTPLYDTELRQWNWYMLEEQVRPAMRCAPDYQLLGVLVEAKLLSTLARPLAEAVPPLPVTEAW